MIDSDCDLFFDYGKKVGVKLSRNNACTNRLVHYNVPECRHIVWSYNMQEHFFIKHADRDCDVVITEEDIAAMKK